MQHFLDRLDTLQPPITARRWIFVPYDQLNDGFDSLLDPSVEDVGIVLVEATERPHFQRYHKQKLALILSNQRHFALEQAAQGRNVFYVTAPTYRRALERVIEAVGQVEVMEPAERALRKELEPLILTGRLIEHPNRLWLTQPSDFRDAFGAEQPWRMDRFYKLVRRRYNVLIDDDGSPTGGRWSFDHDNRKPWKGTPQAPDRLYFEPDPITEEVAHFVATKFHYHPGQIDVTRLPATRADAITLWQRAKQECMVHFGTYEDAMSTESPTLFHTLISSVMNIGRLSPHQVIEDVLEMPIPMNSKEGFIRQILGWREFIRHVHQQTDGLRDLPTTVHPAKWSADGTVNHLSANEPLPPAFWGEAPSGLACLDQVVNEVVETGYTHHINRLMVLANWATLLGVSPRELTDWFWSMFTDAYDWVVEPNVLGMGTFATGPLMSTKPYISGSAYMKRMSDYCGDCQFKAGKDCPMTSLYWSFLNRNAPELKSSIRMLMPLASARRRTDTQKAHDEQTLKHVRDRLRAGKRVTVTPKVTEERQHGFA
ncbi:MAG: cryptochrome/photolyase family protein [Myxococcota bacterium]|nr:cryptochrome/photolyase family protein [Myxococcota bacterium]